MTIQSYLDKLTPITLTDKLFFVQYLSIMLKAGMSIAPALAAIAAQTKNRRFRTMIATMQATIEHGVSLTDALKPYEKTFGTLFMNMVNIGEKSGTLEGVLAELYVQMKKDHEIRGKVRGALVYPIVILTVMLAIGIGVIVFIIPKLQSMFAEIGASLPLPTKILIAISTFITANGLLVTSIALALVIGGGLALRKPSVRHLWHNILLHLPIIGPIVMKVNIARMTRTLSALLITDIPITEALTITGSILANTLYRELLTAAAEEVKRGIPLGAILPKSPALIPPTLATMVVVGETTGALDTMLKEIASFYESDVAQTMETLPSIIEPLLMVTLGLGVGGLAVAIVMPMYSLAEQI